MSVETCCRREVKTVELVRVGTHELERGAAKVEHALPRGGAGVGGSLIVDRDLSRGGVSTGVDHNEAVRAQSITIENGLDGRLRLIRRKTAIVVVARGCGVHISDEVMIVHIIDCGRAAQRSVGVDGEVVIVSAS